MRLSKRLFQGLNNVGFGRELLNLVLLGFGCGLSAVSYTHLDVYKRQDLSILDIYVPIKHGARVDLIPDELGKSPRELATFISSHKISVWYSTPAILSLLAEFGQLEKIDFSALRLVLFAGEVFPVKQLRKLAIQWPSPSYYNLYGPTETNVCTYSPIPLPVPDSRTEPYPIGWACSHCNALVLDPENQVVNSGDEGLLYISGPPVFSGCLLYTSRCV